MARHSDEDEIGPRRPRWPQPRERVPLAVALDQKPRPDAAANPRPGAPRVVATGRGAVAEQILAIAFAQGVPVREDPDLVELLATLELDAEVPIDAIAAVAEILSYVYRANRAAAGDSARDDGPPRGAGL
ncbi:flagellar biosynthesis protein [Dongia mobilis]|uniref:Flagellar biosynthesis protein n=1 Tax=Dongia mobilis TaxID=578943 RepID=A0A4R6WXG7_9PROT|nr:EscU/YscU/HrcU family type III secretion system export apparatus switch protein [Dongia mobilis]TDQ84397.1 flagellar biosynthesis protein [Dongia mobilis]